MSAATVIAVAVLAGRSMPRDRRIVLAVLVAILLFAAWKFAFVRYHVAGTFVTLVYAAVFLAPRATTRRTLAALAITTAAFLFVTGVGPAHFLNVATSVRAAARESATALRPWRWDAAAARTEARLRAVSRVPDGMVARMEGRTVHIDPWRADVATAYPGIRWRPMPVYQSYSAYTAGLDELDAGSDAVGGPAAA